MQPHDLKDILKVTESTYTIVDPNVIISGYKAAADPKLIQKYKITRIVRALKDPTGFLKKHKRVKYIDCPINDTPGDDIRKYAVDVIKFIQEGIKNGEVILVHCHAGISRSASIVLLHLMINRGKTLKEAFTHLKKVRPQVRPNRGFAKFLADTDARLQRMREKLSESDNTNRVKYLTAHAGEDGERLEPPEIPTQEEDWKFEG